MAKITGTLHEDQYTFFYFRMRTVSGKCRGNQTHFIFNNFFFLPKMVLFMRLMWKNMVQPDRPQMTTQNGARALHAG